MILILDNYDSFTYNLYQYVGKINNDVKVIKNDALSLMEITLKNVLKILIVYLLKLVDVMCSTNPQNI